MKFLMRLLSTVASAMGSVAPRNHVGWRNFSRAVRRQEFGIRLPAWTRAFFLRPVKQAADEVLAFIRDGKVFYKYSDGTVLPAMMGGDGSTVILRRAGMPESGAPSEIDANVKIRWVDDLLVNMADRDADMLKYLGGFSNFVFNNTKVEWVEDDVWNRRPKLGSGTVMSGSSNTGTLTLAAGTNHRYPVGAILFNVTGNEHVRVESHDSGGADVTVRRDIASAVTEASLDWASTDEVIVAGFAMNETDAWVARPSAIFDLPYNLAQIAHVAADVTYRRQETALYGLRGTDLDKIAADSVAEQFVYLEGAAVHGSRQSGAANIPATFGGLKYYITSANGAQITDLSSAALTRKDIDDLLQALYFEVGGAKMARTILTSPWGKRKISSFFSAAERLGPKATEAGVAIDNFNTDFGQVDVMLHTALAKNELLFINPEMNKIGHHGQRGRPHLEEAVAVNSSGQTGPFLRRVFYSDVSMVVKGVEGEGRIHTFSTSA